MTELSVFKDEYLDIVTKAGYSKDDIVFFAIADLTKRYRPVKHCVFTTRDSLVVTDGEKTSLYGFGEIESPSLDEKVGTSALMVREKSPQPEKQENAESPEGEEKKKPGKLILAATFTNDYRQDMRLMVKYLSRQLEDFNKEDGPSGEIKIDEDDFKKEDFCPKCHKRYPDPKRKVCPDCMDKSGLTKRFLKFASGYKTPMIIGVACLIVTSILAIVAPYISTGFFYDQVLDSDGSFYGQLIFVIVLMISTEIATIIVNMICNIVMAKTSAKLVYDLKMTIFDNIKKLSMSFFTGRQTGGLMTQINTDADGIYWFFVDGFPYYFSSIFKVVTVFILMLFINFKLALLCLIPLPFYFIYCIKFLRQEKFLHAREYVRNRNLSSILSDSLSGARVVKAFAKENDETKRYGVASRSAAKSLENLSIFNNTRFPLLRLIMYMSTLIAWGIGGWLTMKGQLSYGNLLVFISYVGILNGPMMSFVDMSDSLTRFVNSLQRLFEILDATPDVVEAENPIHFTGIKGEVEFKDVNFSYEKGRTTIENVSFKVEPGQALGIVGHSGAGKSTLANLLIRLYDTDNGSITIDGLDLRKLALKDLRDAVAIVSQETYLFTGTIMENIAYARPDADKEEILSAAKAAGAHDFIMKMPDAYQTKIGFGYKDLSGGERQRLSIARAILKNPKILILDEATAAMDTQTEKLIQTALTELSRGRTTIMIAHRLSTLRDCNSLIVIEHGKMPESGTHTELIKQKGIYYNLYKLQLEALKNIGVEE